MVFLLRMFLLVVVLHTCECPITGKKGTESVLEPTGRSPDRLSQLDKESNGHRSKNPSRSEGHTLNGSNGPQIKSRRVANPSLNGSPRLSNPSSSGSPNSIRPTDISGRPTSIRPAELQGLLKELNTAHALIQLSRMPLKEPLALSQNSQITLKATLSLAQGSRMTLEADNEEIQKRFKRIATDLSSCQNVLMALKEHTDNEEIRHRLKHIKSDLSLCQTELMALEADNEEIRKRLNRFAKPLALSQNSLITLKEPLSLAQSSLTTVEEHTEDVIEKTLIKILKDTLSLAQSSLMTVEESNGHRSKNPSRSGGHTLSGSDSPQIKSRRVANPSLNGSPRLRNPSSSGSPNSIRPTDISGRPTLIRPGNHYNGVQIAADHPSSDTSTFQSANVTPESQSKRHRFKRPARLVPGGPKGSKWICVDKGSEAICGRGGKTRGRGRPNGPNGPKMSWLPYQSPNVSPRSKNPSSSGYPNSITLTDISKIPTSISSAKFQDLPKELNTALLFAQLWLCKLEANTDNEVINRLKQIRYLRLV